MILTADLDRTLIFSARRLTDAPETVPAEYREGVANGFMTARALSLVRALQKRTVFLVNTLRGEAQAARVVFVGDGSCRYLACQNGLYLYRDGKRDDAWAAHVARAVSGLPLDLTAAAARVQSDLPGVECLSKQYEYLAVFFVDERFDDAACRDLARELAGQGWELYRQGRKLYLSPLAVDKGAVVARVRELEDGAAAVGFGDSYFDLPMLAACARAYSLAHSELAQIGAPPHVRFSRSPAQAGTEEVLGQILREI